MSHSRLLPSVFRAKAAPSPMRAVGLDIATAWGYLTHQAAEPARGQLDRLLGICWRLTERVGQVKGKAMR